MVSHYYTLKEFIKIANIKKSTATAYLSRGKIIPQKYILKIGKNNLIDAKFVLEKYLYPEAIKITPIKKWNIVIGYYIGQPYDFKIKLDEMEEIHNFEN